MGDDVGDGAVGFVGEGDEGVGEAGVPEVDVVVAVGVEGGAIH